MCEAILLVVSLIRRRGHQGRFGMIFGKNIERCRPGDLHNMRLRLALEDKPAKREYEFILPKTLKRFA